MVDITPKKIKIIFLVVSIIQTSVVYSQLKDVYESVYFTNGAFINVANLVKNDKYFGEVNVFSYSPSSNNNTGAFRSFSAIASKSLGKNGSVGIFFDVNSVALFNQSSLAARYAYLAKFSENIDLAMGFGVGFKNSRIDENSIISIEVNSPDPLVSIYNNRSGSLYTDVGINLRYKKFRIQGSYYDLTSKNKDIREVSPKLFAALEGEFNMDAFDIKPMVGLVQYYDKSNKIIAGAQFFYNPIAISGFYSSIGKYTATLDFFLSENLVFNIGYVFGPYYSNPVYGQTGNIVAGVKYIIP